jgi:hypothetical protein
MDVDFFFKLRTDFTRKFYDEAVRPFLQKQKLIEAEEEPYVPPYSEDGEPPFLEEWTEADTSIQIIGRTAISLLSESLKVYFIQWEKLLGIQRSKFFEDEFKKKGYWSGYRRCFAAALAIDWTKCPADLEIIEQIASPKSKPARWKNYPVIDMSSEKLKRTVSQTDLCKRPREKSGRR